MELRYTIPGNFPIDKISYTFYQALTCTKTLIHVINLNLFQNGGNVLPHAGMFPEIQVIGFTFTLINICVLYVLCICGPFYRKRTLVVPARSKCCFVFVIT